MGKLKVMVLNGNKQILTMLRWMQPLKLFITPSPTCWNLIKLKIFSKLVVVQENCFQLLLILKILKLLIMQLIYLKLWLNSQKKDLKLILLNIKAKLHLMSFWKNNICILVFKTDKMLKSSKVLFLTELFLTWSFVMLMILKKC